MLIWITALTAAIGALLVILIEGVPVEESVRIRDLPFASHIRNPCSGTTRNRSRTPTELHLYSIAFYRYMAAYSALYMRDATRAVNEEANAEEALKQIHSSLLLHAAYAYFVDHQFATASGSCSEASVERERTLAKEALILARKQKHMACMTQMTLDELGFARNATDSLLDESFANLRLCSRRALRDCQVMLSISHLLDIIGKYSKSILDSMEIN